MVGSLFLWGGVPVPSFSSCLEKILVMGGGWPSGGVQKKFYPHFWKLFVFLRGRNSAMYLD